MSDKKPSNAYRPPIYHGDEDDDRLPYRGAAIRTQPEPDNSGRRAVQEGSGVVSGSGAAAGGTEGISEDPDSDPIGGSGAIAMPMSSVASTASDDETARGPGDATRVSLSEDYEVEYWTNRFSVSRDRLKSAVDKVGPSVDAVAKELNN
jgi:hypothetical protein